VNFVNDYTPEDIVNEVISSLPEKNEFYFNRDGDNLFRYLTQLMDMSKFDSNLAFYSSIDEENSKYVDGEGYLTYPEIGQTYTISLKAILKYGDAEADKQITVVVNNEEEDRGTRLAIVQGAAVTSGDSFFVEGEVVDVNANLELKPTIWETLTLSVIAEEGTFKPSEQNFPIEVIGPSQVFVIGTDDTTYKVSDDGSIFTFDMAFMRLNTGGKAEFKIPGVWFEDGEPRYTKYITVRKN
jgi:hypothetical protein